MTDWIPNKNELSRPYFLALAEHIAQSIVDGCLLPGERLPTHRELAMYTELSLQTVTKAYTELARWGVVKGEVGRGSYVAEPKEIKFPFLMERTQGDLLDLSISRPVGGPIHIQRTRQALRKLGKTLGLEDVLLFRPSVGMERHRETGRTWLRKIGVEATAQRMIITDGASQALTIALMTATRPGDHLLTEVFTHHSLIGLSSSLGLNLGGVATDREGIIPQALDDMCRVGHIAALFLTPTLANPTGMMMPETRRREILAVAKKHQLAIIENDVLGPLPVNRPLPLYSLDSELVYYVTSFTKCVMPGLRTGYLVVPKGKELLAAGKQLSATWMAAPLMAELAATWIEDGTAEELMVWQREAIAQRNQMAREIIGEPVSHIHDHGLHFWIELPNSWSEEAFVAAAHQRNVAVAPGKGFAVNPAESPPAVRVCLGVERPEQTLAKGLHMLSELLKTSPAF